MGLLDLKAYMMQVKITTLTQLAAHFRRDPFCLRQMLQHWIQKGKIRCCQKTPACEGCQQCPVSDREIFEWVDAPARATPVIPACF